jgi:hypothetical protein
MGMTNTPTARPLDLRKTEVLSRRPFIGHWGALHGPLLLTVETTRTDGCKATEDGWHRTSYSVLIDGVRQCGGFASHLGADGLPRGATATHAVPDPGEGAEELAEAPALLPTHLRDLAKAANIAHDDMLEAEGRTYARTGTELAYLQARAAYNAAHAAYVDGLRKHHGA